jgi:pantoate--beta-alanine ligase
MRVVSNLNELEALRSEWGNATVALVPTMGALHEGHGALCQLAKKSAQRVIVSIFVNPLQFGPNEDLERYPRPREEDLQRCQDWGMDAVFYPSVDVLYPTGMENSIKVLPPESLSNRLCGASRPGHFAGVATVVLKLFIALRPDYAVFGEKDAQQLFIIRHMVKDLLLPVALLAHPTVREIDGLALSSRNRYLQTPQERETALTLFRILTDAQTQMHESISPLPAAATLKAIAETRLAEAASSSPVAIQLQYLEAVEKETFQPAKTLHPGVKILIAAMVGSVRLIDNLDL